MAKVPMWRRYIRFWGPDVRDDLRAEVDFHIEELTERYVEQGLTPSQARAAALRKFGDVDRVRAECLTIDVGWERAKRRRGVFDALSQDVRFGLRMLARSPGSTVIGVLMLALGVGANTTIYSFVTALVFPSVPIQDSGQVVRLVSESPSRSIYVSPVSEAELAELKEGNRSFIDLAGYSIERLYLTGGDEPYRIIVVRATANLFALLGVEPALGRSFVTAEATPGRDAITVLSHRSWQLRFDGDPRIVGRIVHLEGRPHTIIGVMPEDFWFAARDAEAWIPLKDPRADGSREPRNLAVVGRLKGSVTPEKAQADVEAVSERMAQEHSDTNDGWRIRVMGLVPLGSGERVFFGLLVSSEPIQAPRELGGRRLGRLRIAVSALALRRDEVDTCGDEEQRRNEKPDHEREVCALGKARQIPELAHAIDHAEE